MWAIKNNAPVKPTKAFDKSISNEHKQICPVPLYHNFGVGARKDNKMSEIIFNKSDKLNSPIVRMEGIKEAAALFGLPKHLVRTLALEGKVKAVRVSNSPNSKILVNIQSLNDYFENAVISNDEQAVTSGGIQPIPVRL